MILRRNNLCNIQIDIVQVIMSANNLFIPKIAYLGNKSFSESLLPMLLTELPILG